MLVKEKKTIQLSQDEIDSMMLYMFRYCLGRMSYSVSDCVDILSSHWDDISPNRQVMIESELKSLLIQDGKSREDGLNYLPMGMDCDRQRWSSMFALWGEEVPTFKPCTFDEF